MRKYILILSLILIFTSLSFSEENKKEPVIIEADELIFKQKINKAIYIGDVVAKKGDMSLYSNKMEIFLDENGDITKIIATGNVKFYKKPDREGRGDIAIYEKDSNTITLKGKNAFLKQGENIVEGEVIVYYLDTEITEVKSNKGNKKRVKSILFPKNKGAK